MKKHLKGLDTLRAIAALVVVVTHIELIKSINHLNNIFDKLPSGHVAVILFFVLSGFLITYLLMQEIQTNNKISFRKFYLRRILRIWPLYYLIILLSILFIGAKQSVLSYLLCLTIFPNIAHILDQGWLASPQIWSIGLEEQFYLVWPLLFSMLFVIRKKFLLPAILIFIVGYTALPHALGFINVRYFQSESMITLEKFFYLSKYNSLAIGAFIGVLYANKSKWVNLFNNNLVLYSLLLLTILLWLFQVNFSYFTDEIFSLLFAAIILSVIGSKTANIDTAISKFLGKISYGIYMYHWIVIILIFKYLPANSTSTLPAYNLKLYALTIGLTILVSWLSYTFFEKKFLKLKPK